MRGHGTVNTRFAFESLLDTVADELGLDPAEVRLRNQLKPPCLTVNQLRVTSYGYPECIEKVVEKSGWKEKRGKLPFGKGIGIAGSHYVSGAANPIIRSRMPHTTVNLKVDRDGAVTIYTGRTPCTHNLWRRNWASVLIASSWWQLTPRLRPSTWGATRVG
jgi:4-hydroxybenzoyl-CoA reductase subunit alpha